MATLKEKIEGGLVGLLVGDALGVPYEFHQQREIPPLVEIEFDPPEGFQRSHGRVLPGTWSDDGAHALILLASLLHCGKLELESKLRSHSATTPTRRRVWPEASPASATAYKQYPIDGERA